MAIRNLPSHTLQLMSGLATNLVAETVAGQSLDLAANVDGFSKFRGIGKIPGSTKINSSATDPIHSIHYFEFFDLDRTQKRRGLALTGTVGGADPVLRDFDPDVGTLTSRATFDALESLAGARMNHRFHLTSPGQGGGTGNLPTGGAKYDGTRVTNWGVQAPGADSVTLDLFEDHTDWTVNTGGVTLSTNTANSIRGGASVQIDIPSSTLTTEIEQTFSSLDMDPSSSGTARLWLFLPSGSFQELDDGTGTNAAFEVEAYTNSDSAANQARWRFTRGDLALGWNLLSLDLDDPDESGVSWDANDVDSIQFKTRQRTSNAALSGVLINFLHTTGQGAPLSFTQLAASGDDYVDGDINYRYLVTFVTEYGLESNAGPASPIVSVQKAAATATTTAVGAPSNNDRVTVGGITYTWVTSLTSPQIANEVLIGASSTTAMNNLVEAIIANPLTSGTAFGSPTTANSLVTAEFAGGASDQIDYTAEAAGTDGNSITLSESASNLTISSFSGGTDGSQVQINDIPVSSDTSVIARRIYRDAAADGIFLFVTEIADNTTVAFTDTNNDQIAIGPDQPPLAGDASIDHTPPEAMADCVAFESRIFGIRAEDRLTLLVSNPNEPEQYPILNQIQLDERLTALKIHAFGLLVYGTDNTFLLSGAGTTDSPFLLSQINTQLGANGFRSVEIIKSLNIAVREREVFLVDQPADSWYINGSVQDQWDTELTTSSLPNLFVIHDRSRFRALFFGVNSTTEHRAIWVYQYGSQAFQQITGEGRGTDPQDVRVGAWYRLEIPTDITPLCGVMGESSSDVPELWVGTNEGFIQYFQDPSATDWAITSGTEPVAADFRTASVPIGADAAGRGEPRYLKINSEQTADATWTVDVDLLTDADGRVIATKSFSVTLPSGNASVIAAVPSIGARGEWCRVRMRNAVTAETSIIRSLTLYYIPRADFRGPRVS